MNSRFRVTWVLRDQLALGPAPRAVRHLERLRSEGVKAILSLCSELEAPAPEEIRLWFSGARVVLPDHRVGRPPSHGELLQALSALQRLQDEGPVYVHCVASMERSPLVCLAWLMRERGLTRLQALDYLTQQHPGTNPLPEQLDVLRCLESAG
jgi:hypothetical protein